MHSSMHLTATPSLELSLPQSPPGLYLKCTSSFINSFLREANLRYLFPKNSETLYTHFHTTYNYKQNVKPTSSGRRGYRMRHLFYRRRFPRIELGWPGWVACRSWPGICWWLRSCIRLQAPRQQLTRIAMNFPKISFSPLSSFSSCVFP